jgi:CRISPR-associated protein Cmr6
MTVHHAAYYGATGDAIPPPSDSDDPNPVPFVTARGRYLVALEGPPTWTDAAMTMLKLALRSEGIGAKTAAGYGRLNLDYTSAKLIAKEQAERTAAAAAEQDRKARATEADRERRIDEKLAQLKINTASALVPQLLALAGDDVHSLAQKCETKLGRKAIREAMKNRKEWVKPLAAVLYPGDIETAL